MMNNQENDTVSQEERFLFDLQGFLILRNVLSLEECGEYLEVIRCLESQTYEDKWMKSVGTGRPTLQTYRNSKYSLQHQIRLNGLPRLDSVFDQLIDQPKILSYLYEFVGQPHLVNTWSISKLRGAQDAGGWHGGVPPTDYSYRNDMIRSRMLNVVYFLTDNGPDDGCMVALPGGHKSNIDLVWNEYNGLQLPGSVPVTGKAGDVFLFSETVLHEALPKRTDGVRSNLYYNYVHAHYNAMAREPNNCHHFYFPPEIRQRFNPKQLELTAWMEFARWEY